MTNSDFEQKLADVRDTLPRLWWSIYQGCLQTGFDKSQSFDLLGAYIVSQNPNGSKPNTQSGPDTEKED